MLICRIDFISITFNNDLRLQIKEREKLLRSSEFLQIEKKKKYLELQQLFLVLRAQNINLYNIIEKQDQFNLRCNNKDYTSTGEGHKI